MNMSNNTNRMHVSHFNIFPGRANCKIDVLFVTQNIFAHSAQNYLTLPIMKAHFIF